MNELSDHEEQILGELNEQQKRMLVAAEEEGGEILRAKVLHSSYPVVKTQSTTFIDASDPELSGAQANEDLAGLIDVGTAQSVSDAVCRLTVLGIRLARHLKQRE